MSRVAFSLRRLWFIAHNTLREAVRQRIFSILGLLALALVWGAQYFRELHFGSSELKFIADLGGGALAGFGAILAVVATAQLFYSEIEQRTVLTLLAKPVWRAEFILGKFLGVAVVTGAFCGLLTGVLATVLWTREASLLQEYADVWPNGRVINYPHLAAVGLMEWLKLLVLSALTLLVASYARTQLFTTVTGCVVFFICQLQHLAQAASARAGASALGVLTGLVARVFPNFQYFDLGEVQGGGGPLTWSLLARVASYALAYVAAACALAVFSFRRREL